MSILKQLLQSGPVVAFMALSLGSPLAAQANTNTDVVNAVSRAIETNPEVRASWHEFLASGHDTDSAFGGYLPSVDANARYGYEHRNYGPVDDFDGYDGRLTLTQMLYDGFQTSSSVERLEEEQLVSYYELLSAIEETSLEALRAYLDVQRQRELLELAQNNLDAHQEVFDQVSQSAEAGVARAADLEQISGRLSLAESNLVVVASNLHDVKARYLRIIGVAPSANLQDVELGSELVPMTVEEALAIAYEGNPDFRAAHRDIQAAEANVEENRSGYHPRLNFVVSYGHRSYDDLGFDDSETDGRVGLELSMNLYRGGSDRARVRSAFERVNVAKGLRDKACVDIRQEVQIAHNNVGNLEGQIPILNNHRLSSARVRTAYKDQFDIGERTLLDVLDAENEYFDASRAYVNAIYDRKLAVARVQAGMGHLVSSLGLVRDSLPTLEQLGAEPLTITKGICPTVELNGSLDLLQDSDGDGVRNYRDQCPNTLAGARVDPRGCALESPPRVIKRSTIEFANDSARIQASSTAELARVAQVLSETPESTVLIIGHASKTGAPAYNQELSIRRAEAVAERLVSTYGIARERISVQGQGFYQPRFTSSAEAAVDANRRADIQITAPASAATQ